MTKSRNQQLGPRRFAIAASDESRNHGIDLRSILYRRHVPNLDLRGHTVHEYALQSANSRARETEGFVAIHQQCGHPHLPK